jgi:hypothetical protein
MEDDFSVEKPRISKLTGPNYRPWSVQVKTLLLGQSLWDVVELGIYTKVTGLTEITTRPNDELSAIESTGRSLVKDAKARTVIMGLCSRDALGYILLCESAKEQWETLKGLYAPLGLQQLSAKIQAFTGYIPSEEATTCVAEIANYLTTLQAEIGYIDPKERPSNTLKTSIFYKAIRVSDTRFDPLILQLELTERSLEYSTIVAKFMEFERRIGPKTSLKEKALKADTGSKPKKPREFKGKCYNCGEVGHRKPECKKPKEPESNPSTGPLATLNSGRNLSPGLTATENTKIAEISWMATVNTVVTEPQEPI